MYKLYLYKYMEDDFMDLTVILYFFSHLQYSTIHSVLFFVVVVFQIFLFLLEQIC